MASNKALMTALANILAQANGAAPHSVPAPANAKAVAAGPREARNWSKGDLGISKAGYPTAAFATATKNGGTFTCTIPADLANALRSGQV